MRSPSDILIRCADRTLKTTDILEETFPAVLRVMNSQEIQQYPPFLHSSLPPSTNPIYLGLSLLRSNQAPDSYSLWGGGKGREEWISGCRKRIYPFRSPSSSIQASPFTHVFPCPIHTLMFPLSSFHLSSLLPFRKMLKWHEKWLFLKVKVFKLQRRNRHDATVEYFVAEHISTLLRFKFWLEQWKLHIKYWSLQS